MQKCTRCKEVKPFDEFYKGGNKNGLASRCIACKKSPEVRAARNAQIKIYNRKIRSLVFKHYGEQCSCCGQSEEMFLCIDHIDGGGNAHRKEVGSGSAFYQWLVRKNYPEGFQTLCFNCNMAKGFYGICPHQKEDLHAA